MELDESVYDEIVKASRQTGIGRMRLVGVILVSCQDRFAELVAGEEKDEMAAEKT